MPRPVDGVVMLLILILLPLLVWMGLPESWHRPVGLGLAALTLLYAIGLVVKLRRASATDAATSSVGHYRWKRGAPAAEYARSLRLHLGVSGWRIDHTTVMDPAHVLILAHKDRDHVALLCRNPSGPATPIEATLPLPDQATRLLIVRKPSGPDEHPYAVLKDLDAALLTAPGA